MTTDSEIRGQYLKRNWGMIFFIFVLVCVLRDFEVWQ